MSARATEEPATPSGGGAPHPVARVDDGARWTPIWIVPLLAVGLAAVLAWQAWGDRGVPLQIAFEHGHGLKPGDSVRHLGITVGQVQNVTLSEHGGVDVAVALDPEADHLARVGSRFWIVRPQLGIAGVEGLDTLVGNRYIAVLPGTGGRQSRFDGLAEAPVADALEPGLDVTLEGITRHSLTRGSPVTYRGIHVGSVLAVGLASDARTVEVQVRIRQPYAELIREDTRFWSTSGVTLDVGITGISLQLDTLQDLARGGLSLATPPTSSPRVRTGHRFALAAEADPVWLLWDPPLPIGHSLLPPGVSLPRPLRAALTWEEGTFWSGDERREGWVLSLDGKLLAPADLLVVPEDAYENSTMLEVEGESLPLADALDEVGPGVGLLPVESVLGATAWPRERQRVPEGPEDALAVGGAGDAPLSLSAGRLSVVDGVWEVDRAVAVTDRMHGAAVVGRRDGALIGVMLVDDEQATVVPLPRRLP